MLLYGCVAKWRNRVIGGVAMVSMVGAVAAVFVAGDAPVGKFAFAIFLMSALVAGMFLTPDMAEKVLPVPDDFYKPLGAFGATVRNVAPHVVEIETDSGAVLFADAGRVPEVSLFRGSRVEVDAAVVVSPAGQGDVRADGVGGFVDARKCKCTAGYGADVAMGDEPRSKWNGKARFYAVTAVRAAD